MGNIRADDMKIDVHSLRYFMALADEGSLRRAANVMHITQPTFSRQISQLEERVGKQLYTRKAGRVHLTHEGRVLYGYAERIVELADQAAYDLSGEAKAISGRVVVGCAESIALETIARCIRMVREQHPDVIVDIVTGSPLESFERLEVGIIDFLLEVDGVAHAGYEKLVLPGENTWVVIVPADDPLAALDVVRPSDLAGKGIVCSRLVLKSGVVNQWFGNYDVKINATFNLGTYLINVLAANKVGYCLTYEELHSIVGDPRVFVRPLDPPIPVDRSVVSWKRGRTLSPACRVFLETLRDLCDA